MPKPYKAKLKTRKNKIKNNKHNRKYIDRHPTIPNFITAVYCKGCGTQIKGLNSEGLLFEYSSYREMLIEFDNGSSHLTPICRGCTSTKTKDDLEAMYISDLEEFDIEDDGRNEKVWDMYLGRKPEKIGKEKSKKK